MPGFTLITLQPLVLSPLVHRYYTNSPLASQQKCVKLLNNHPRPFYEIRPTGKISECYVTS